jgi:DNA-binding NarL/FixJ family response regulator
MSLLRILIVDDHEAVRRSIRSVLSTRVNLLVCGEAVDGEDAVAKAKTLRPDLLLMDISMPRMFTADDASGVETVAAAHVAKSDIPETLLLTLDKVICARQSTNGQNADGSSRADSQPQHL